MRIVLLANNRVGAEITSWLRARGEDVVALVLHPEHTRKCGAEIVRASGLAADRIFVADDLRTRSGLASIRQLNPDIGVSVMFGYIVRADFLAVCPSGCLNVHPGLLPYNRGAYSNVWSIVDRTPAGATIHFMDEGVDTGDIVAQRTVDVDVTDTGATLHHKLEEACVALFTDTWDMIKTGRFARTPQRLADGTTHRVRDVERIDEIQLERSYTARDLIDILRARTFAPFPGAFFVADGQKVYMRLDLTSAADAPDEEVG